MKQILVCEKCGSSDKIQVKEWRYVNSGEFAGDCSNEREDNWCDNCQEHVYFTTEEEWTKKLEEDEL